MGAAASKDNLLKMREAGVRGVERFMSLGVTFPASDADLQRSSNVTSACGSVSIVSFTVEGYKII